MTETLAVTCIFSALLVLSYILTSHFIRIAKVLTTLNLQSSAPQISFLHESAIAIVLGFLVSTAMYNIFEQTIKFSDTGFFLFILPPVIFAAGYTLKKRNFMRNISYIMTLGVFGTMLAMLVLSTSIAWTNQNLLSEPYRISPSECLLMVTLFSLITNYRSQASVLCATDTIAVLTLINEEKYMTLNAVLFGEGVVNDAVAILLFRAIESATNTPTPNELGDRGPPKGFSLRARDVLFMCFSFLVLAVSSMVLGVVIGLLTSLVLKYIPKLNKQPVKECTIILVMAYISYLIAEHLHFSGIITLFSCGFTMSHYAYHNISTDGQKGSAIAAETCAGVAESFLYVYLGLSAISIQKEYVYTSLIITVLVSTIVARMLSVFIPIITLWLIKGRRLSIGWNEILLIAIGGIIRGAIAFGLSLGITSEHASVLKTTVQIVVLITTVILGSTMGLIAKCLNIKSEMPLGHMQAPLIPIDQNQAAGDGKYSNIKQMTAPKKYPRGVRWFRNFDKRVMIPIFRRNQGDRKSRDVSVEEGYTLMQH